VYIILIYFGKIIFDNPASVPAQGRCFPTSRGTINQNDALCYREGSKLELLNFFKNPNSHRNEKF
jgi:hypothetical protein